MRDLPEWLEEFVEQLDERETSTLEAAGPLEPSFAKRSSPLIRREISVRKAIWRTTLWANNSFWMVGIIRFLRKTSQDFSSLKTKKVFPDMLIG